MIKRSAGVQRLTIVDTLKKVLYMLKSFKHKGFSIFFSNTFLAVNCKKTHRQNEPVPFKSSKSVL